MEGVFAVFSESFSETLSCSLEEDEPATLLFSLSVSDPEREREMDDTGLDMTVFLQMENFIRGGRSGSRPEALNFETAIVTCRTLERWFPLFAGFPPPQCLSDASSDVLSH